MSDKRGELLDLIHAHSFERRAVTLSSGKQSDFYLDLRTTLMLPRGLALAGELVLERILAGPPVHSVGGMAVGAVPLVAGVLLAAASDERASDLRGFFVRKQKKAHGLGRQLEGHFEAGQSVALVEDTCTTGGSTLEALEICQAAGARVVQVLCLVDRGEGASEAFADAGIRLEALYTRADLPV